MKEIISKQQDNAYQEYLNTQLSKLEAGYETTEDFYRAEPDLLPELDPHMSPELEAAIGVLHDGGLQALSSLQQKIFQLSIVEGLREKAVAASLGISQSEVSKQLKKLGRTLRILAEARM